MVPKGQFKSANPSVTVTDSRARHISGKNADQVRWRLRHKAFAAGVILSTGFIHVLPDAIENLTSPCLDEDPWRKFPLAGLVAMLSAIATWNADMFANSHLNKTLQGDVDEENTRENEGVNVQTHGSLDPSGLPETLRYQVVSQVLELGILVRSVIIGISVGASESPKTIIKPLVAALTFHQLFEGMGLGGCISQAQLKVQSMAIMAVFFSLTTPVGIAIGIGISSAYDESSPTALIVEVMLNAASAGILIYMALVDLSASDFMNPKLQNNGILQATCEARDRNRNDPLALKYKVVAIIWICVAGAFGVSFPLLGKTIDSLRPERNTFFIIKAFASGVILSTGFIHVFPDATRYLTFPCLDVYPWRRFPFAGLVTMVCAIGTLMKDMFVTSHYTKSQLNNNTQQVSPDEETTRENEHAPISPEVIRYRVLSQVLELGVLVHSVIIGITLGASHDPNEIKSLLAALSAHQVFEGMGVGGCISQAQLEARTVTIMTVFFSITIPVGILIGIGISNIYNENNPKALIVRGILTAVSAGILIYMALVNLLAVDFMNPKLLNDRVLKPSASVSLFLGAFLTSFVAIWA
ncbi:Zinc transporter 3 [Hibiscus syriacus]|uniref:Zinc transporter 3 n=1 Tax=Hibiscus syriacus TaxID=106335 RepID=A0A6A2XQT4_HIBSY|nr:Zinc transporter 3 [Hibiscus syriacus]